MYRYLLVISVRWASAGVNAILVWTMCWGGCGSTGESWLVGGGRWYSSDGGCVSSKCDDILPINNGCEAPAIHGAHSAALLAIKTYVLRQSGCLLNEMYPVAPQQEALYLYMIPVLVYHVIYFVHTQYVQAGTCHTHITHGCITAIRLLSRVLFPRWEGAKARVRKND